MGECFMVLILWSDGSVTQKAMTIDDLEDFFRKQKTEESYKGSRVFRYVEKEDVIGDFEELVNGNWSELDPSRRAIQAALSSLQEESPEKEERTYLIFGCTSGQIYVEQGLVFVPKGTEILEVTGSQQVVLTDVDPSTIARTSVPGVGRCIFLPKEAYRDVRATDSGTPAPVLRGY